MYNYLVKRCHAVHELAALPAGVLQVLDDLADKGYEQGLRCRHSETSAEFVHAGLAPSRAPRHLITVICRMAALMGLSRETW